MKQTENGLKRVSLVAEERDDKCVPCKDRYLQCCRYQMKFYRRAKLREEDARKA